MMTIAMLIIVEKKIKMIFLMNCLKTGRHSPISTTEEDRMEEAIYNESSR